MRRRYADRLSGPIRDRIDIHRTLTAPARPELAVALGGGRGSGELKAAVARARERQGARLADTPWAVNSDVPGADLRRRWPVLAEGRDLIDAQLRGHALNPRSADRVLRLAWTVADLAGHDTPTVEDVEAGLALRRGTPLGGTVRDLVQAS